MGMNGGMVDAHVGSTLEFEVQEPAEVQLMIAVCPRPGVTIQRASAALTSSGVGAVPPRWAGIHQVSSGPFGRTG